MAFDFLESQRSWLAAQPRMRPWEQGCVALARCLEDWLASYTHALGVQPVRQGDRPFDTFVQRLWQCWSFHWQTAVRGVKGGFIDGLAVAEELQAGRGFVGGGDLGGDVLRDVVLAQAILQKDNVAVTVFEKEFKDYALRQARRTASRRLDDDDVWSLLVDQLGGYSGGAAKLARYSGRCGLRNWLGTVVRHLVWDLCKARNPVGTSGSAAPEGVAPSSAEQELVTEECRRLWMELMRDALTGLEAADRLLMRLRFAEHCSGKEAAVILGIHAGTLSRREEKALERLKQNLQEKQHTDAKRQAEYADCLRHLWQTGAHVEFAQALVEVLIERPS